MQEGVPHKTQLLTELIGLGSLDNHINGVVTSGTPQHRIHEIFQLEPTRMMLTQSGPFIFNQPLKDILNKHH